MKAFLYHFLDTVLQLQAPADVLASWNSVYGGFEVVEGTPNPVGPVCRIEVSEADAAGMCLCRVDGEERRLPASQVLCLYQHVLLNGLLARSERFLVWHGAAWTFGGGATVVLGASCLGKTTLALAAQQQGAVLFSDEIAAVERSSGLVFPFPRAVLARRGSATLAGLEPSQQRVCFEEEKEVYPVRPTPPASLFKMVHMAWPLDGDYSGPNAVVEWELSGSAEHWQAALGAVRPDIRYRPHPDGGGWWRLESDEPLSVPVLEEVLRSCGMVLRGYHRGARRRPDYVAPPQIKGATATEMTRAVLSSLINGRTLVDTLGAAQVLTEVRSLLQGVEASFCVPGRLDETLQVLGVRR